MNRLLKLEWLKNANYRPFRIFTALYFGLLVMLLFIGMADFSLLGRNINLKEQGMYNFPEIWNFTTYIVALLKIFPGCIIIFSVCREFSDRMFKQNLIDGLGRDEFIQSKLLTIALFSIFSTLLVFIITLFLGQMYSQKHEAGDTFREVYFIGNYFVKLFSFFTFLLFLSVLLRKSIFVFLGFVLVWIAEGVLGGIEKYTAMPKTLGPEALQKMQEKVFITDYLPLKAMSRLIPAPYDRTMLAKMLGVQYQFHYPSGSLVACIIWTALFVTGSYFILKKKDW